MARRKKQRFGDEGYLLDQSYGRQDWDDDPFDNKYRGYGHDETDDYFDPKYGRMEPDPFGAYGSTDEEHAQDASRYIDAARRTAKHASPYVYEGNCGPVFLHMISATELLGQALTSVDAINDRDLRNELKSKLPYSDVRNLQQAFSSACVKSRK